MRKHLTLTLLLGLCIKLCLTQTLVPGIAENKSGGVVTRYVTPICMGPCKPNADLNWSDISYNPNTYLGYMPTKCVIYQRGAGVDTTKIEITYENTGGAFFV